MWNDSHPVGAESLITSAQSASVANHWLLSLSVAEVGDAAQGDRLLWMCCEELEILGREYGNDEGGATGVTAGDTAAPESERPDDILQRGLLRTALHLVVMPPSDLANLLPESTPGYLHFFFPEVFLSGDGDPYQERPVSIRQPPSSWIPRFLHWASRQPQAEGNVEFQFVLSNQLARDCSGREARVALILPIFPTACPRKSNRQRSGAVPSPGPFAALSSRKWRTRTRGGARTCATRLA